MPRADGTTVLLPVISMNAQEVCEVNVQFPIRQQSATVYDDATPHEQKSLPLAAVKPSPAVSLEPSVLRPWR